jgi:hypothetical protein
VLYFSAGLPSNDGERGGKKEVTHTPHCTSHHSYAPTHTTAHHFTHTHHRTSHHPHFPSSATATAAYTLSPSSATTTATAAHTLYSYPCTVSLWQCFERLNSLRHMLESTEKMLEEMKRLLLVQRKKGFYIWSASSSSSSPSF